MIGEYPMRKTLTSFILVLLCLGLLHGGYAKAQQTVDEEQEALNKMFEQVLASRAEGDYTEAIFALREIIQDNPRNKEVLSRSYSELVFTYILKGEDTMAETIAREALGWFPDIAPDSTHVPPTVGKIFDDLREQLFGSLIVTTDPKSCRIVLDGRNMGQTPLNIPYLRPGEHHLRLSKNGYRDVSRMVFIEPGKETNADYSMGRVLFGPRSGFGIGGGVVIPYRDAAKYGDTGGACQGFGTVGIPYVPFAIIRAYVQGLFFGAQPMDGELIEGADSKSVRNSVLKLGIGAELFEKARFLEAFAGGGISIQYIWNELKFDYRPGEEPGEFVGSWVQTSSFFRGGVGLNINAGLRTYFANNVSIEAYAQYDFIPNVNQIDENLERVKADFHAFAIMLNIYFGRTYGGNPE
jgi:hypothetical protein